MSSKQKYNEQSPLNEEEKQSQSFNHTLQICQNLFDNRLKSIYEKIYDDTTKEPEKKCEYIANIIRTHYMNTSYINDLKNLKYEDLLKNGVMWQNIKTLSYKLVMFN